MALICGSASRNTRPRDAGSGFVRRTREVNRALLGSPVIRPLYLAMWVPNGLIVGCEALFVPFAGERAGYLFAVTAAGMLLGDVFVGRFRAPAGTGSSARCGCCSPCPTSLPVLPVAADRRRARFVASAATPRRCPCRSGW